MKRILTWLPDDLPRSFAPFVAEADIYDSSCSPEARVYFVDKESGVYLKKAAKGTLKKEAAMYDYFHKKGLAPEVLAFESGDNDWMLTCRVSGEDCTWQPYLDDPVRLCDTTARLLRTLHETSAEACPVPDRTGDYLADARKNYQANIFSNAFLPERWKSISAEEAWHIAEPAGKLMRNDTLLHGDYCLPNIMLDNWQFSGFIDLDGAGMGDRHIDLFWGVWTLQFNLKTHRYGDRFLDAYGRDCIDADILSAIPFFESFG